MMVTDGDDDVYLYIGERQSSKERRRIWAPCLKSLHGKKGRSGSPATFSRAWTRHSDDDDVSTASHIRGKRWVLLKITAKRQL